MGILLVVSGLFLLTGGAELLVRGAASLALRLGVSSLAVGLTVVAFGTSMPEMVVSVRAALAGIGDIAVGNVVGSNIFNVAVILGVAALICPVPCHANVVRREAPIMIGVTLLLIVLAWWGAAAGGAPDGGTAGWLSRPEGLLLAVLIVGYTSFTYLMAKRESATVVQEFEQGMPVGPPEATASRRSWLWDGLLIAAGLVLLIVGAQCLVDGAVTIARALGVSELVIGLTIVAAGTSMPELATSVVAALRHQPDISLGNVVGSNIFNVLGILGVTAVIQPLRFSPEVLHRDLPFALLLAVLCVPLMYTGRRLSRLEGAGLLILYVGYLALLLR